MSLNEMNWWGVVTLKISFAGTDLDDTSDMVFEFLKSKGVSKYVDKVVLRTRDRLNEDLNKSFWVVSGDKE